MDFGRICTAPAASCVQDFLGLGSEIGILTESVPAQEPCVAPGTFCSGPTWPWPHCFSGLWQPRAEKAEPTAHKTPLWTLRVLG